MSFRDFLVDLLRTYLQKTRRRAELQSLYLRLKREASKSTRGQAVPPRNETDPLLVMQLIDEYRLGASTYQLAARHGLRRNTVRDVLRRSGVEIREGNQASLSPEQKREIRERAAAGEPRKRLTRDYGVSDSTIRRAIRDRAGSA